MVKLKGLIRKKHVIVISAVICGFAILHFAPDVKAEAGSGRIIYDSTYIDKMEASLRNLIQTTSDDLKKQISASGSNSNIEKKLAETEAKLNAAEKELASLKDSMQFKVVKLPSGKIMLCDNSTEIILRTKGGAKAYIEKTASGGLSNLISGKDLKNGEEIPDNQLILVPNGDGRGIKASRDSYVMVKGKYTIK